MGEQSNVKQKDTARVFSSTPKLKTPNMTAYFMPALKLLAYFAALPALLENPSLNIVNFLKPQKKPY